MRPTRSDSPAANLPISPILTVVSIPAAPKTNFIPRRGEQDNGCPCTTKEPNLPGLKQFTVCERTDKTAEVLPLHREPFLKRPSTEPVMISTLTHEPFNRSDVRSIRRADVPRPPIDSCWFSAPTGLAMRMWEYVREFSISAYDTATSDAERFVEWLVEQANPDDFPFDRDLLSPYSVEFNKCTRQLAHIRFQELRQSTNEELDWHSKRVVHVNPVLIWASVDRPVESATSSVVVFFPVDESAVVGRGGTDPAESSVTIHSVALEEEARRFVRKLERRGATRLRILLSGLSAPDQSELRRLLAELADVGLIAVGW